MSPSLCSSPFTEETFSANTESYGGSRPFFAEGHGLTLSSGSALTSLSSAHRPACSLPPSQLQPASSPLKALYLVTLEALHLGKASRHGWSLTLQDLRQGEYQPQSPPRAHPNSHQAPEGYSPPEERTLVKLAQKPVSSYQSPRGQCPEEYGRQVGVKTGQG